MDNNTALYLEFLRFCLNDGKAVPQGISQIKWHELLAFARKQCNVGI